MLVCDVTEKQGYGHSFRHTFCINLAQADVPLHVIQELTGHRIVNTLGIYLSFTQREMDEAIAKIPRWNRKKREQPVFT